MDDRILRGQLKRLHEELGRIDTLDGEERELLGELARDIREVLGRDGDRRRGHYGGLVERLRESVARVEASHADAALLMRKVIDELSYLGI